MQRMVLKGIGRGGLKTKRSQDGVHSGWNGPRMKRTQVGELPRWSRPRWSQLRMQSFPGWGGPKMKRIQDGELPRWGRPKMKWIQDQELVLLQNFRKRASCLRKIRREKRWRHRRAPTTHRSWVMPLFCAEGAPGGNKNCGTEILRTDSNSATTKSLITTFSSKSDEFNKLTKKKSPHYGVFLGIWTSKIFEKEQLPRWGRPKMKQIQDGEVSRCDLRSSESKMQSSQGEVDPRWSKSRMERSQGVT